MISDARSFYAGIDLHTMDFTAALRSADPMGYAGVAGEGPAHPSFEDRPGAADRVFAALDDAAYRRQVDAWARELRAVGAAAADVLHLHHLTPLNAAAARAAPGVPIVGAPARHRAVDARGDRGGLGHALAVRGGLGGAPADVGGARRRGSSSRPATASARSRCSGVDGDRVVTLPNGFDPMLFRPLDGRPPLGVAVACWSTRRADGGRARSRGASATAAGDVGALMRGPVILYVGRFTEVKRLTLLLEAFAEARPRMAAPASLVLVGGHPGEWEGEHPAETIERLGLSGVHLAGWHDQSELPELLAACDLLVLPSARESFGQVIVEAMACGVPAVAAASLGPAHIIEPGETGWLFGVDDRAALTGALVDAVNGRPSARGGRSAASRSRWSASPGPRSPSGWPRSCGMPRAEAADGPQVPQAGKPGARRP